MKRRRLGQHYLVDPEVVQRMVDKAAVSRGERVLEIGTGKGVLTERLAAVADELEGYEVDQSNYEETSSRVKGVHVRIHLGDAFQATPRFDVLVSSLPYSQSAQFISWISRMKYDRAVVLLQKDFVEKVMSPPGGRDYRAVSAIAQISSQITIVGGVSADAFLPPPRVRSTIVTITPRNRMSSEQVAMVRRMFSLRRQRVSAALRKLRLETPRQSFGNRRVYSLTPNEIWEVFLKGHAG